MDPAAPRRAGAWPFVAMLLLVSLLAAFLVLQWNKTAPAMVKTPDPVAVPIAAAAVRPPDPAPPPAAVPEPVKPKPDPEPPPQADDKEKDFERHAAAAAKAVSEKRWDAAEEAVKEAAKIKADPKLEALSKEIASGREAQAKAAAAAAEERRKRDERWPAVKAEVEKLKLADRWDAALKRLDEAAAELSGLRGEEEFRNLDKDVRESQVEADSVFSTNMKKAEEAAQAGKVSDALKAADKALIYYPEREPRVRKFKSDLLRKDLLAKMIKVPESDCWIGSDEQEDEKPLRKVRLKPFLIDKYEVTNEEYLSFVLATGHPPPPAPYWDRSGNPDASALKHPVVGVAAADAEKYAAWAGKRLPTAEEWEVAARGPDKRQYPWGEAFSEKENVYPCNCLEYWQVERKVGRGTMPVDAFDGANSQSPWGVSGMAGNVWEWTASARPKKMGETVAEFRVLKGGSFMTPARALRCSNIFLEDPKLRLPDAGFRCAADVK